MQNIIVLVTLSAVALVELMVLPVPVTLTVALVVALALKPVPLTVSMVRLPPVKLRLAALVPPKATPVPAPVSMLTVPEKATVVPPVWSVMLMAVCVPVLRLFVPEKLKTAVFFLQNVATIAFCFVAAWGFFEYIAITNFNAKPEMTASQKYDAVDDAVGQDLFLWRKQIWFDLQALPHVLGGGALVLGALAANEALALRRSRA